MTSAQSDRLIAVDITAPDEPTLANSLETGIHGLEGIFVTNLVLEGEERGYAFVGGYRSTRLSAIDLTNVTGDDEALAPMSIVKTLDDSHYVEMVSEMDPAHPGVLFCALWGEKSGGLATFDISDPENMRELDHVETLALARANRVKIQGDYAFLPLEQETGGGIGIVNISDPSNLSDPTWKLDIDGVSLPYTLAVKGDYIYVFGVREKSMAILKMSPR